MNSKNFNDQLTELKINLSENQLAKFDKYKEYLKEYNKKFNLTSILEDDEIYIKHFYDSLCLFKTKIIKKDDKILDIGTGAGFPGIPLAIVDNSIKVTLVESNKKKCEFLEIIKNELNLNNIEIINERAENYTKKVREKFDIVTSRAVSHLQILLELEIPALKVDGYFLPLKSNIDTELKESEHIMKELNVELIDLINYSLPYNLGKRTIPLIKKNKISDLKYPRNYSKIIKSLKKL